MSIRVVTQFLTESTVLIRAYVTDMLDAKVDPTTSIKVSILDPDGNVEVDGADMTKATEGEADADYTGVYDYIFQTDVDTDQGKYVGVVKVVDGSGATAKTSTGTFNFEIKPGINVAGA